MSPNFRLGDIIIIIIIRNGVKTICLPNMCLGDIITSADCVGDAQHKNVSQTTAFQYPIEFSVIKYA